MSDSKLEIEDVKKVLVEHLHRSSSHVCSIGGNSVYLFKQIEESNMVNKEALLAILSDIQKHLGNITKCQDAIWNDLIKKNEM